MNTKKKLWIGVIGGLVLLVLLLGGIKAGQIVTMVRAGESFAIPPEAVTSAKAEAVQWERTRSAVASLVARQAVTLTSELGGAIREIAFEAGSDVKRGQLLVRLDTSMEDAQLASAVAEAELAKLNLERARSLRRAESNTQAELDAAEARGKQAEAAVATLRATIAKKTIRAPFDGRISIRQVDLGQVVASGTPIASLHSVSPIHADFWLPQQALANVTHGQKARLRTDAFPGKSWDGQVETVNPQVDPATRNVRIRATFTNPGGTLRPGMFGNVEVIAPEKWQAVVIPATAVLYAPYGDSVFVIEKPKDAPPDAPQVALQKFVRLGERRGDFVAVTSGLNAGETVVSTGAFKLKNGMPVVVNNALAPDAKAAPKPVDE
ncbi:MAG TPA: efflux RND transporter periplasmic adaptor subunit [Anaeromyxobacteraceae bacterium]|nr:efflux RND transporter periplasmic adaptor subunit [Anaeromyxobacteraceae bacterium]